MTGALAASAWLWSVAPAAAGVQVLENGSAAAPALQETPLLKAAVDSGALPPVGERLPSQPLVVSESDGRTLGKPGGDLHMLVGRAKDTRLLVVYGYARLVCYNEKLELTPDIAEKIEVEDGRIFTFTLRPGHKWSDGAPFTTEDMRYFWEDVANNEMLSPSGPSSLLLVDGEPPKVEVIDELTIRYSWSKPNPYFLPALAGASPLFIYRPAHYLKKVHENYADADALKQLVEERRVRNWAALHNRMDNQYRFDNPGLPTLQPWVNTTSPPAQRFVAKRNPYYHRVDSKGQQLPYIDEVVLVVASGDLIPAKTGAGDSDLQARGLNFSDYTFLKKEESRGTHEVRLWRTVRGSRFALYPNLNAADPVWRDLFRDARFRRALSHAIDRDEINQSLYFGLGLPGNHSVLPGSPLHLPDNRQAYATFDLKKANALLDQIGLTERDDEGVRLLPDGRPLEIVVETAGENTEEVDTLELIGDGWRKVGVKLFTKPSQREVLRNRIFAGETLMTMWFGYENAVPTGNMSPSEFAPVSQHGYQWPKWGQFHETKGQAGEAIDLPEAQELMALYEKWTLSQSLEEQEKLWRRILEIHADQVYTIGLVALVPQPVVVAKTLHNVPLEAMYNWNPGAEFGIYRTDSFWIE
ncbi:MAG: ABC transporter substrate-binding protein [Pseudomonadota bacterium]